MIRRERARVNYYGVLASPPFISKPSGDARSACLEFGSSQSDYMKWGPHICGICCLKMVGDRMGLTRQYSLYDLTVSCFKRGGFVITPATIKGVFHFPLAALAVDLGIPCMVAGSLTPQSISRALRQNKYVALSIDLTRLPTVRPASGPHLVLIYGIDRVTSEFILHDCSNIIAQDGDGAHVSQQSLLKASNAKGLIFG